MKKIVLMAAMAAVCIGSVIFYSCNKEKTNGDTKLGSKLDGKGNFSKSIVGAVGVKLQLNRRKGTNRHYQACECIRCFGICSGNILEDESDYKNINGVISNESDGVVKLFVLEDLNEDVFFDSTLYVDDEVFISGKNRSFVILPKNYRFKIQKGEVKFNNKMYNYNGYAEIILK